MHLEEWLAPTIQAAGRPDLQTVVLAEGLPLIQEAGEEPNPHLWLDVQNAKVYVETDPGRPEQGGRRQRRLSTPSTPSATSGQLDALDAWIRAQVATIPPARRKLVTFHDAFPYFARRYGLQPRGASPWRAREGALGPRDLPR